MTAKDLLNEENEHHLEEMGTVEGPTEEISEEEVKRTIKGMKSTKASGPTGVTNDMLKKAGIIREMTRVFRNIVDKGEIPKSGKTV